MSQSCVPMPAQSTAGTRERDCLAHRFGNAADNRLRERRYPSDMTDAESQLVKADAVVGAGTRGFDGGRLVNGRKRHVVADTLGLLLGVMVTAGTAICSATSAARRTSSSGWPSN